MSDVVVRVTIIIIARIRIVSFSPCLQNLVLYFFWARKRRRKKSKNKAKRRKERKKLRQQRT
jgi:hypothetical protein